MPSSGTAAFQHTPYRLIGLLRRAGSRLRRSESQNSLNLGYSGVGCLRGGFSLKSGYRFHDDMVAKGFDYAQQHFRRVSKTVGWPLNIPESVINEFAYNALSEGKIHKATELFKRNTQDNPNSANAWDGLADAYAKAGHLTLAVQASDRAVALASQYANPHLENFIAQAKKRIVQIHK